MDQIFKHWKGDQSWKVSPYDEKQFLEDYVATLPRPGVTNRPQRPGELVFLAAGSVMDAYPVLDSKLEQAARKPWVVYCVLLFHTHLVAFLKWERHADGRVTRETCESVYSFHRRDARKDIGPAIHTMHALEKWLKVSNFQSSNHLNLHKKAPRAVDGTLSLAMQRSNAENERRKKMILWSPWRPVADRDFVLENSYFVTSTGTGTLDQCLVGVGTSGLQDVGESTPGGTVGEEPSHRETVKIQLREVETEFLLPRAHLEYAGQSALERARFKVGVSTVLSPEGDDDVVDNAGHIASGGKIVQTFTSEDLWTDSNFCPEWLQEKLVSLEELASKQVHPRKLLNSTMREIEGIFVIPS
ncbi:hypothetical protein SELMODRAFT_404003 [Selaginella moellendorffii]|uniref:Uncharacterized protein n=1 Tax=Selaginella moellendorffii TaxID=88036 RepID=D8QT96_SELML|nr:hypothetical protein SELMODRAFT_404003 [Selaginella moellendorffii]